LCLFFFPLFHFCDLQSYDCTFLKARNAKNLVRKYEVYFSNEVFCGERGGGGLERVRGDDRVFKGANKAGTVSVFEREVRD
jgi:hypothetical protein